MHIFCSDKFKHSSPGTTLYGHLRNDDAYILYDEEDTERIYLSGAEPLCKVVRYRKDRQRPLQCILRNGELYFPDHTVEFFNPVGNTFSRTSGLVESETLTKKSVGFYGTGPLATAVANTLIRSGLGNVIFFGPASDAVDRLILASPIVEVSYTDSPDSLLGCDVLLITETPTFLIPPTIPVVYASVSCVSTRVHSDYPSANTVNYYDISNAASYAARMALDLLHKDIEDYIITTLDKRHTIRFRPDVSNSNSIYKHICIVGCGSVGSELSYALANAGVKQLTLIDDDRLEIHNISRHVLTLRDLGRYKVDAMKELLETTIPGVIINAFPYALQDIDYDGLDADLFICTADSEVANAELNDIARSKNRPFLSCLVFERCFGNVYFWDAGHTNHGTYYEYFYEKVDAETVRVHQQMYLSRNSTISTVIPGLHAPILGAASLGARYALDILKTGGLLNPDNDFTNQAIIKVNYTNRLLTGNADLSMCRPGDVFYPNWKPQKGG